ncbi:MAG: OmpA family protein [Anaerolineaceae bacterium]|nr:MAG: OmpA family protein [Anaerolineaceae bacterium]
MVILKYLAALPPMALILIGCASTPPSSLMPRAQDSIAWIDRQFKTCSGKDCPVPTRKTLAIVELPVARKEATPSIVEVPKTAPPVTPSDETVTVAATVLFEFAKDVPSTDGRLALNRLAAIAVHAKRIELEGRTDDIGGKAYNDRLAQRRAEFVRAWLINHGVAAEVVVRAEGLCCYLDTLPNETARRNNRRVEVRLVIRQDAVSNSKGAQ